MLPVSSGVSVASSGVGVASGGVTSDSVVSSDVSGVTVVLAASACVSGVLEESPGVMEGSSVISAESPGVLEESPGVMEGSSVNSEESSGVSKESPGV